MIFVMGCIEYLGCILLLAVLLAVIEKYALLYLTTSELLTIIS